jgi:hypothetical protein
MNHRVGASLLGLLMALPLAANDAKTRWLNYADAKAAAKASGKPIFLVFR